jgi:hypothetical protein
MTINKNDIEWVKKPLNLQRLNFRKDEWEMYKEKLEKAINEFNPNVTEEKTVPWIKAMKVLIKNIKSQGKAQEGGTWEKDFHKYQERVYNEFVALIKEKEWAEKTNAKVTKNEEKQKVDLNLLFPKNRGTHVRSVSLPPRLNTEAAKNFEKFELGAEISESEEESEKEQTEIYEENRKLVQKLRTKNKQLEKEVKISEIEKEIEKTNDEISNYKQLIERNSSICQELKEKKIIAKNDEDYAKINRKIEKKVKEHQQKLVELDNQLVVLQEEDRVQLITKIEVPNKQI